MSNENKNPFVAGLFNMLIPGSAYLYVDKNPARFIKTLLPGILLIAALLTLGNAIQNIRGYSLPQGLCPGILLLIVLVPLFVVDKELQIRIIASRRKISASIPCDRGHRVLMTSSSINCRKCAMTA